MGGLVAAPTRTGLIGLVLAVVLGVGASAGEAEPWMPETLPGFIRALELGITQNLSPRERAVFSEGTYDELRETQPELHEKIRHTFVTWTDAWVRRASSELERVPAGRIERARQAVADVDERLRVYFHARGWPYRPPKVVFLPQRLMAEPALPSITSRGFYFLYYPDVLFASLDAQATLRHTLIHESLHFNKTGRGLGRTLDEGIAEAAATQLALAWGVVRPSALRQVDSYPYELRVVDFIIDRMVVQTGMRREHALEVLLQAYLTGDSAEMATIFGADAWSEVIRASRNRGRVRKTAKRVLGTHKSNCDSTQTSASAAAHHSRTCSCSHTASQ